MIKRYISMAVVALFVLSIVSPVHADTPIKKFGRGLANLVTSPFEILYEPGKTTKVEGWQQGATWGVVKGILMVPVRAVVGVYEMTTFPIPGPADYGPILTDPEYLFDDMNWR